MNQPLVTVITAVYNGEQFLGEALQSLFAQDYKPFEAIVVDDGSTDATPEVVQTFSEVRYVRQANSGQAAARNRALGLARGEYTAFLDADDLWPPRKLSLQVGYLQANPGVACVLGRQEIMLEGIEPPEWMTRDSVFGDLVGVPLLGAMIRTDVLRDLGGFDTSYRNAEDRDLFVRLREQGRSIAVIPDIVLYRRFHGANLTGSHRGKHPLLRSLKAKVDRSREDRAGSKEVLP
jgi:glycosyltransferase involved in cell wall biosynthesis